MNKKASVNNNDHGAKVTGKRADCNAQSAIFAISIGWIFDILVHIFLLGSHLSLGYNFVSLILGILHVTSRCEKRN